VAPWDAHDGAHEVLSHGDERPARRTPVLLRWVATVALAVGFAAGALVDGPWRADPVAQPGQEAAAPKATPGAPRRPAAVPVVAGLVTKVGPAESDRGFRVSLFNTTDETITATVVALPGWLPELREKKATTIPPRSWGLVPFTTVATCRAYPAPVRVVHVRVWTDTGSREGLAPLSQPAKALQDHFAAVCD
jgi:hypothetical protein